MQLAIADFLSTAVYFAIVLGALIVVHEFGHFIVAKKSGVRVERFSVGFGPPLWRKQWRGTEYRLALVPLGGYVKMYGEQFDETIGDPGVLSCISPCGDAFPSSPQVLVLISFLLLC